jgi:hypothetical protein
MFHIFCYTVVLFESKSSYKQSPFWANMTTVGKLAWQDLAVESLKKIKNGKVTAIIDGW